MKLVHADSFIYSLNEKEYLVNVLYKSGKRNITYRFRDGAFLISCPPFTIKRTIIKGLDKFAFQLIKNAQKQESSFTDKYLYLLGNKVPISYPGQIEFTNGYKIAFKDEKELRKKLKSILLDIVTRYTREFEKKIGLKFEHQISVKNMKTRYGSNMTVAHKISYAFLLIHYSYDIIKSVCAHEVVHALECNHSKRYYDLLFKYYPEYYVYNKKLKKGIYQ